MNIKPIIPGKSDLLPTVDQLDARVKFLRRLKFFQGLEESLLRIQTKETLASYVDDLEAGKSLVSDEPDVVEICDRLILSFNARLHTIDHENHLRQHLGS